MGQDLIHILIVVSHVLFPMLNIFITFVVLTRRLIITGDSYLRHDHSINFDTRIFT